MKNQMMGSGAMQQLFSPIMKLFEPQTWFWEPFTVLTSPIIVFEWPSTLLLEPMIRLLDPFPLFDIPETMLLIPSMLLVFELQTGCVVVEARSED